MTARNLAVLALVAVLGGCVADQSADLESRTISLNQNAEPAGAAGVAASESVGHLLPATGPTYVTVTVSEMNAQMGSVSRSSSEVPITSGSGFLVSADGYAMTAAHVAVAKGNQVSARAANGRIYSGTVAAVNPTNDMALIKLSGFTGRAVRPASPGCMQKGDLVYTLGKPHGEGDTARVGSLDSKHFGRPVVYGKFGYPDALVLHMGTQRGESGGPVYDNQGRLIGMVVSTLSDSTGQSINLAHAIPATQLAKFYCSQTSCDADWAAVAQKTPDSCN